MERTLVIAEPGSTWEADLDKARRLIDCCKDCGADVVKFQWTSNARRIAERRNDLALEALFKPFLQFPVEWLGKLKEYCDRIGIEFACTVYIPEDIPTIEPFVKRFKVASFEAQDLDFIRAHARFGKDLIISTGLMRDFDKWHARVFEMSWRRSFVFQVLHCVTCYPCPLDQLNLAVLRNPRNVGGLPDGLSDHTTSVLTGALAVAAGARTVEKHVRLWSTPKTNADYPHSLDADFIPAMGDTDTDSFSVYVHNIREAERAMGDGKKRLMDCEKPFEKYRVNR